MQCVMHNAAGNAYRLVNDERARDRLLDLGWKEAGEKPADKKAKEKPAGKSADKETGAGK